MPTVLLHTLNDNFLTDDSLAIPIYEKSLLLLELIVLLLSPLYSEQPEVRQRKKLHMAKRIHVEFLMVLLLCTCSSTITKCFFTFISNVLPITGLDFVAGEEFRTHTDAENSCLEPFFKVFLFWCDTACNHNLGPWHRCHKAFDKVWTNHIAGEHLGEITANFLALFHRRQGYDPDSAGRRQASEHECRSVHQQGLCTPPSTLWVSEPSEPPKRKLP